MYFSQIFTRYQALLIEFGNADDENVSEYRPSILEKKLQNTFGKSITIEQSSGPRCKKIVFKTDIDVSVMANNMKKIDSEEETKFEDVAFHLRNCVKTIDIKKLPNNLTADDVIDGECQIPEILFKFMQNLIDGPEVSSKETTTVKITSICSDIIYAITKGRCKPAKNLTLGLAMKSLTNSRQVITILNRYGHTIGYNLAEEIETEMTFTAYENNKIIPNGIDTTHGRSTHVAFDNFDRFVDTTSGKDTMHDTVGIIYQFPCAENSATGIIIESTSLTPSSIAYRPSRKRRRFSEISREIRPYYSKPTAKMQLLNKDIFTNIMEECRNATQIARIKDILWIISLSKNESIPMWLGFNCLLSHDRSSTQIVEYLPPINASPTSYVIVNETLEMANEIAKQCQQDHIIVTYDLAIAKMAMQIQENEKPKFDNIFVNLGAFHLQMAFFKAIGKFIDSCGLVEILVQADVLAGGSMNSFLDSKHFNRCKRLHPLTAAALQILHFNQYISTSKIDTAEEILADLIQNLTNTTFEVNERIELPELLHGTVEEYTEFCKQTLTGKHGKTAQYYYQYCELINLFLRFSRSIRTSNFELYLESIYNMSDLFFALNQPNYARWCIIYLSNLIKLNIEHSPLLQEFRKGAFGIRRTEANFARSPVDLTLEQTINADASNQLTNNLTANSVSARQRWALSHSMRTKILTAVKENIGLSVQADTLHSLQKSKIQKDRKNVESIIQTIKSTMNPFDSNIDKNILFNISTGKAASSDVTEFLINVKKNGNDQKSNFITECSSNSERFESPIKRNVILNFASECTTKEQVSKDRSQKVLLKMERDIFGRLLAISLEKKVNIEHCLSFPLAPMPPALFTCAGEMIKTNKSTLAKTLKSQVQMVQPTNIDVEIIDGFYYLYTIGSSMPITFGKIAESILIKICSTEASEIHLIFDRYLTPSIKDSERLSRQAFDVPFKITGPLQTRPVDFLGNLKNYRFKESLVQFLSSYWENDHLVSIISSKKIFLTVGEECYSYRTYDNKVVKTKEDDFSCQHEEADTRITYHAFKMPPRSRILVKASDTDVLIILLANMHKFSETEIFLTMKGTNNINNCINCSELAIHLGRTLCQSLASFHAFTGCDYTSAFFNKGKIRPFKLLSTHEKFQKCFKSLLDEADIFIDEKMDIVQEFTCLIYGIKNCSNVNFARFQIFQKNYSATNGTDKFIKKITNFASNMIPPCWESLKQKILRTVFVNSMWTNATNPVCVKLRPESCGWMKTDSTLKPVGFIGEATPLQVDDLLNISSSEYIDDQNEENNYVATSDESDAE